MPCDVTLMNARRVTPAARSAWPCVDAFAAAKQVTKMSAKTENNPIKIRSLRTTDRVVRVFFIGISYGRGGGVGCIIGVVQDRTQHTSRAGKARGVKNPPSPSLLRVKTTAGHGLLRKLTRAGWRAGREVDFLCIGLVRSITAAVHPSYQIRVTW